MPVSMPCPRCAKALELVAGSGWRAFRCGACRGMATTTALLRKFAPRDRVNELWAHVRASTAASASACPDCARPMASVQLREDGEDLQLDACAHCQLVWFDAGELAKFSPARQAPAAPGHAELSDEARRRLLAGRAGAVADARHEDRIHSGTGWRWLGSTLGW